MLLVFLEFLGHGEFMFQKSCQKLNPSLRYLCLVFIPFFGTPCICIIKLEDIVLQRRHSINLNQCALKQNSKIIVYWNLNRTHHTLALFS